MPLAFWWVEGRPEVRDEAHEGYRRRRPAGTHLALSTAFRPLLWSRVAAMDPDAEHLWTCRWSRLEGQAADGRLISMPVWICEHPFRTILLEPPPPGACGNCPVRGRREPTAEPVAHPTFKPAAGF
jgi:hypothetical protein